MKGRIRGWAAGLLVATTAACATPPPIQGDAAAVEMPAAQVRARLERSLQIRGLKLLGNPAGPGPVVAMSTGAVARGWASCPTLTMSDPSRRNNRRARVDARDVTTRATVGLAETGPGTTHVAVRTEQLGTYVNPFTNNPVAQACSSTGRLEQELLDALRFG
ncbi:MAG: hypothetical protein AB7I59_23115 [Geminicoccaceae bacterium]